ncbi:MAG: deoxynucleoside kinase [Ruminococcus sp.]|nr:deoxynucleoside kinase [Ruminococcus sp.]
MAAGSDIIVIEGLDGSGKSTQFEKLSEYFKEKGREVRAISFPDYDNPSSVLVKMYLGGEIAGSAGAVNAYAASSFYAVDRYVSFKQLWEQDYKDGKLILAARYVTSNYIYQMTKLDESDWDSYISWLEDYEYGKLGLPRPSLVIFLDMPIEISQRLMSARYGGDEGKKDIHESDIAYLKACRKSALYTAKRLGWKIIECSEGGEALPVDTIFEKIVRIVEGSLEVRKGEL